jgi:hypothetical protein
LPDSLKEAVLYEGIGALAFIPLKEEARLIGKFMAYHDVPHVFAASEIDVGLTIARLLTLAGIIARACRPAAGELFLAFPAIFCARNPD